MKDDISQTIIAKSDQLNAADLMGGPVTLKILNVTVNQGSDQPVVIEVDGGYQVYKPCKSMRRMLAALWGTSSKAWIGNSITVYCDPEVTWAGQAVGGIRISHATGITAAMDIPLRSSRSKIVTYTVEPLSVELEPYQDSAIEDNKGKWAELFAEGKATPESLIAKIRASYALTSEQESKIKQLQKRIFAKSQDEQAEPTTTLAELVEKLKTATTAIEMDELMELGNALPEQQRAVLQSTYDSLNK